MTRQLLIPRSRGIAAALPLAATIALRQSSPARAGGIDRVLRSEEGREATLIDSEGEARGLYGWYSSPTFVGCTISSNTCGDEWGGGIACVGGVVTLRDCEISDNLAGDAGGGLYAEQGQVTLDGCTVKRNATAGSFDWHRGGGDRGAAEDCADPMRSSVSTGLVTGRFALILLPQGFAQK